VERKRFPRAEIARGQKTTSREVRCDNKEHSVLGKERQKRETSVRRKKSERTTKEEGLRGTGEL